MGKEYVTREDVDKAKRTGGAVLDKLMVAKTRVTSNELERALLKVTSHKLKEVNPKHLGRLVQHTVDLSVPKEDMEYIVTELEKRLHNHEWVVVLKSLVTLHALLKHGSRRICDEIVQKQGLFHISHFKDLEKHSRFIKKYSRYLEERCMTMLHTGCGMRIERPKELASELAVMPTQLALRTTTVYMHTPIIITHTHSLSLPTITHTPTVSHTAAQCLGRSGAGHTRARLGLGGRRADHAGIPLRG